MDRQVVERFQISQWCRLIRYSDGMRVLWSGADRYENPNEDELGKISQNLSPMDTKRLYQALEKCKEKTNVY